MFEQTYRELASPSAKLCGLRQQKATDSKGALLSYATFFARTHNGLHAERKPALELFSKPFVEPESVSSVRKIS
jgi:hypothetical protein